MPFIVSSGIFKDELGPFAKVANKYRNFGEKAVVSVPVVWDNDTFYMIVYLKGFLGLPLGNSKPGGILMTSSGGQMVPRRLAEGIAKHCCLYLELIGPSDTRRIYTESLNINYPQVFHDTEEALLQAKSKYSSLYHIYKGWDEEGVKKLFDKIIYMAKARKEFSGLEDCHKKNLLDKAGGALINGCLSGIELKEMMFNYIQLGIYDYKQRQEILKVEKELFQLEEFINRVVCHCKGEERERALVISNHVTGNRKHLGSAAVYGKSSIGNAVLEGFEKNYLKKKIYPILRN